MRHGPMTTSTTGSRGFTVIELLVVIAIVTTLLGLGAAGYLSLARGFGLKGLSMSMSSVARQARNFALEERAFARLDFDREKHTLVAVGFRTVGAWHFEEGDQSGAYGRDCTVSGGEYRRGKVGSCIALNMDGESDDYIDCGQESLWELPSGLMVEAWVFPVVEGKEQTVFSKGISYWLKLTKDGFLRGGSGKAAFSTEPYRLPLLRWSKVALLIEPPEAEIYVDGIIRGSGEIEKLKRDSDAPLRFGSARAPFYGWFDEARVLAIAKGERLRLPPQAKVVENSLPWFNPGGRLDVGMCGTSASFVVDLDGKRIGFRVASTGEIEEVRK